MAVSRYCITSWPVPFGQALGHEVAEGSDDVTFPDRRVVLWTVCNGLRLFLHDRLKSHVDGIASLIP